ncbi:MAG: DNA repair exonuclease [Candidatus Spechtbacterales bacterium]
MKFLHTSDIHLGAKFEILGEKANEQREQLRQTFSDIVNLAISEKVNLFLVAGDLFDSNHPSQKNIDFVKGEFARLNTAGIRVCLIPGNHDFKLGDKKDLGKHFSGLEKEGVFLFTDSEGTKTYFEDINTEVYAKANTTNKSAESPMVKTDNQRQAEKIIMAHGGVVGQAKSPDWPISSKEIEESGADYVALGDWHSLREESKGGVTAYYSGSPEMLSISQSGAGYVIVGTVEYGVTDVKPVQIGAREAKEIEINIEEIEDAAEIARKIEEYADDNLIFTANITGTNRNKIVVNVDAIEEDLGGKFWRLRVQNKSRMLANETGASPEHSSILISGQFVELMEEKISNAKDEEERKLYEEALQLGLEAFYDPDVIT